MKKTILILTMLLFWCNLAMAAVELSQTGQTSCYDVAGNPLNCQNINTCQDGALKMGVAWSEPRFVDNNNGTVTDMLTGLIWSKDANAPEAGTCGQPAAMDWQDALDYINCLNGLNNGLGYLNAHWTLPNLNQLTSLINLEQVQNAAWLTAAGFVNVQAANYWTNDTYAAATEKAWSVSIDGAGQTQDEKLSYNHVWPVRIGPDLIVTSVTPSQMNVKTGQTITVSAIVKNEGFEGVAESFLAGFYLSTNTELSADDTFLNNSWVYINGLGGGLETTTTSNSFIIPNGTPSGQYYIVTKVDKNSQVNDEMYETNNTRASCPITVTYSPPDLVLTSVTPTQTNLTTGQTITVSAGVKNEGSERAEESFLAGFYLSTNDELSADDTFLNNSSVYINGLGGGLETTTTSNNISIPNGTASGQYYIVVKIDKNSQVNDEVSEDNNTRACPVTVTYSPPDLVLTSVTPAQTNLTTGQTVNVTAGVKNEGPERVEESFLAGFYLSTDTELSADDPLLGNSWAYINGLGGGSETTTNRVLTIPNGTPSGQYYIVVKIDKDNQVNDELNENNNTRSSCPITITYSPPDLVLTSVTPAQTNLTTGQTVNVTAGVKNEGPERVEESFLAGFYLSTDTELSADDPLLGNSWAYINGLGGRSETTTNRVLTIPNGTPSGQYYFVVKIDKNNQVNDELNENNNTLASSPVTITSN